MDSVVLKELVDSTVEVFTKMISIKLDPNPAQTGEAALGHCQIMAMVGLAGKSSGIVSVHCSPRMAITITSNMLGMEISEVGDDVKDAIGEVANMVAGNFKTRMSRNGQMFDLSVPTVIVGENYTTKTMTDAPSVILEFPWESEKLYVKLNLKV